MGWLTLLYAVIGVYELRYLRSLQMNKRVYWVVYLVLALSFAYNLSVLHYNKMASPNDFIQAVFSPIQAMLL